MYKILTNKEMKDCFEVVHRIYLVCLYQSVVVKEHFLISTMFKSTFKPDILRKHDIQTIILFKLLK